MIKKRNSNIEVLRIISILFIVISHYSVHNGINNFSLPFGFNRFILELSTLGNIGTILFVLISGYFMIDNKEIKISKLLILYFQVLFYSLGIYLLFVGLGYETFSIEELIKNILPITFKKYWFVTVYVVLYVFSPYINKFLNSISRREYLTFLIVMMFVFSVLHTFTSMDYYGNELIQFLLFYACGAYFKKYPDNLLNKNKKINIIILLFVSFLMISSILILDFLGTKMSIFGIHSTYFFNRTSFLSILFSITLFNVFSNKNEFYSKKINLLSSLVFGVYLLSDNRLIRHILWSDILKNADFVNSNYLIFHLIFSVLIVFIFSILVEFIRKNTIERILIFGIKKRVDNVQDVIKNLLVNLYKKINI